MTRLPPEGAMPELARRLRLDLRWHAKKAARKTIALAHRPRGPRPGTHDSGWRVARALTYHRFGSARHDPFCVDLREFDAQMAYLAEHDLAVSLDEFLAFQSGSAALPADSVLVSIDDGFRSTYDAALPVLRHYRIPAVAFVTAGLVGKAEQPGGPEPYLSWDELGRLSQSGVTIGSHAFLHRSLGRLPAAQAREEAQRSRETLEERLGIPVAAFAYPFGTLADFNADTARILRECGYRAAFTSQHGAVRPGGDPMALPRVKVEGGEDVRMFQRLVHGGLDAWGWVDRSLWRIQAAGGN